MYAFEVVQVALLVILQPFFLDSFKFEIKNSAS